VEFIMETTPSNSANTLHDTSLDIDDMLASFSPKKTSIAVGNQDQRKSPRYRVKWHADILTDDQITHKGFVKDISVKGASVYLNSNLHMAKCTLRIHVPPLISTSKPHIMEVFGRIVYVVYDGEKQFFHAAISFIKFHPESDLANLGERLTKHHSKIPER
jgi:hypothetical protein